MEAKPHAPALAARLERANSSKRCGARRKRDGQPCQQPAMPNGRCRLHGGLSTGPQTAEGKARIGAAALKHGYYTDNSQTERRKARAAYLALRKLLAAFDY